MEGSSRLSRWFQQHDPDLAAAYKAIKVAVVAPVALAIALVVSDDPQLATFAAFGALSAMLFADFPGNRQARLSAYVGLVVAGSILITLATLCSQTAWLAVTGMAVAGFLVIFSGVLSSAVAGATLAALLTFILPVVVPAPPSEVGARLAGFGIAVLLAVPVAVFVWPPHDDDALRRCVADACRTIGTQLAAIAGRRGGSGEGADPSAVDDAMRALRARFRSSLVRPVGLTSGSRLLTVVIDQLGWLVSVTKDLARCDPTAALAGTRPLVLACAEVLSAAADALTAARGREGATARERLQHSLDDLTRTRGQVVDSVAIVATAIATEVDSEAAVAAAQQAVAATTARDRIQPASLHELVYTTELAAHTLSASAAADARPVLDRLLGRNRPELVSGSVVAAEKIAVGHATPRSVWFQNSVRGALGLALAVLAAEVTHIGHGFWVVLGTMSVLRTTALATGATAVRAILGTFAGFLVGAALVMVIGTGPVALWTALPLCILVAAFVPSAVSFVAGQAAFTVTVVVLFNIIQPSGWEIGLVRVEDVAMGCAAALVCGLLVWPRGATAQITLAIADGYRTSARALTSATDDARVGSPGTSARFASDIGAARAAARRLDSAFRIYLSERGAKPIPLHDLTLAANGASRVRQAAIAIGEDAPSVGRDRGLATARARVGERGELTGQWYDGAASALAEGTGRLAPAQDPTVERAVLSAVAAEPAAFTRQDLADHARHLWAVSLHLDDLTRLQARIAPSVEALIED